MNDTPPVARTASTLRTSGGLTWLRRRKTELSPPGDVAALTRQLVHNRMVREVEAMLLFAMGSGIGVPPEIIVTLDRAASDGTEDKAPNRAQSVLRAAAVNAEQTTPSADGAPPGAGSAAALLPGPTEAPDPMSLLAEIHLQLTKLVAPARPATLLLLSEQRREYPWLHSFGAVPLIRKMFALAVLSLMVMLGVALSNDVNLENMTKGLLTLQGLPLLVNEAFLVGAAAVGATLANLKRLDRYVSACTYDERYESSYWTRVVMGVISGVILSQLIYGAFISPSKATTTSGTDSTFTEIGQPVLALLGGFSAELVHDILTHFISVLRNAFAGGGPPTAAIEPTKAANPERS
jgi:hypothetical protein